VSFRLQTSHEFLICALIRRCVAPKLLRDGRTRTYDTSGYFYPHFLSPSELHPVIPGRIGSVGTLPGGFRLYPTVHVGLSSVLSAELSFARLDNSQFNRLNIICQVHFTDFFKLFSETVLSTEFSWFFNKSSTLTPSTRAASYNLSMQGYFLLFSQSFTAG